MASASQLLYGNLQGYEKFFLAFSFMLYVGIAVLVSGLQFYGIIPIGGR